jgi:hypothetical protein
VCPPFGQDDNDDVYLRGSTTGVTIGNTLDQLRIDDIARTSGLHAELTIGTTAVELKVGASALANRKYVVMRPRDNDIYYGYSSGVTTTTGMELFKGEFLMLPIGVAVWLIASGAGKKIAIGELS